MVAEAEILVAGIEFSALRISGALENVLRIYIIPEALRREKLEKIFALDYQNLCKRVLTGFRQYVADTNKRTFQSLLNQQPNTYPNYRQTTTGGNIYDKDDRIVVIGAEIT